MKILVAVDGSKYSTKVVEEAVRYAVSLRGEVTLLHVIGEYIHQPPVMIHLTDEAIAALTESLKHEAEADLAGKARLFSEKGIAVQVKVEVSSQSTADVICKLAKSGGYNIVFVGSRGLGGLTELFLGSVSNKVAQRVDTNVMIIK